jgi:adenylate cyclase
MGDGVLVEFPSVVDAVRSAVEVQQSAAEREAENPKDRRIVLRVGINLGDVVIDGDDIHGDGVNVAARLEGLAEPGSICVSGAVHDQVRDRLDLAFEDLGEQEVKNIDRPIRVWRWAADISATASGPATPDKPLPLSDKPSIAVLPFENMSGDPEQEYFTDGLTEDLITALSYQRLFPVIARNSSFSYKGKSPDVRQVAEELGVRYVLEGSVRKGGRRVRISAQLIDATTGHHIWAERYDRELDDIFAVQDEITERIVGAVEPELGTIERQRVVTKKPESLDAWDRFQRGMAYLHEYTKEGNTKARDQFMKTAELDPSFSGAFMGLAVTYHRDIFLGFADSLPDAAAKIVENARQAIARDNHDSDAHAILAFGYLYSAEHDLSIAEGEQAVALNPSSNVGYIGLASVLAMAARAEEAIPLFEKALALSPRDPRNYIYLAALAATCVVAHRYGMGVKWARKSLQQQPDLPFPLTVLAAALGHLGYEVEAREALDQALRIQPAYAETGGMSFPFKNPADSEHYLDGLRKAGWKG